jgi:hypothetical protein
LLVEEKIISIRLQADKENQPEDATITMPIVEDTSMQQTTEVATTTTNSNNENN